MPTYTIQNAQPAGPLQLEHGNFDKWQLTLVDAQGQTHQAELLTKQGGKWQPQPGQQEEFTLTPSQYGMRAKRVYQGPPAGGGGGWKPDPVRDARIVRQHSQEMALRYAQIKGKTDVTVEQLLRIADKFDADVANAAANATPAPATGPQPPAQTPQQPPAQDWGPPPQHAMAGTTSDDDQIPF